METSAKTLISELSKKEASVITSALEDISNASEEVFIEICLAFDFSSFIANHLKDKGIIAKSLLIITKASKIAQKSIIELLSHCCGGCFLSSLFLVIAEYKTYESTLYSLLIEFIGDVNGAVLESKAFLTCCKRTESIYERDSNEQELCKRLKEGIWSDYVKGLGVLIADADFRSKVKGDAKKVNTLIESFITAKNGFDILKAKELITHLKETAN